MSPIEYTKHCRFTFGSYCQALNENQPTNTPSPRTIGGIFLSVLDTAQGGHKLLNLATARIITRSRVIEIPITNDVIERVEMLVKRDGIQQDLKFKNRKGEVTPDTGDEPCNVDLIAGVDDDDLDHNNNENKDPY